MNRVGLIKGKEGQLEGTGRRRDVELQSVMTPKRVPRSWDECKSRRAHSFLLLLRGWECVCVEVCGQRSVCLCRGGHVSCVHTSRRMVPKTLIWLPLPGSLTCSGHRFE